MRKSIIKSAGLLLILTLLLINACKKTEPVSEPTTNSDKADESSLLSDDSKQVAMAVFRDAKQGICLFDVEGEDNQLEFFCDPELIYELSDVIDEQINIEYIIEDDSGNYILQSFMYEGAQDVYNTQAILKSAREGIAVFEVESGEELLMSGDPTLIYHISDFAEGRWIEVSFTTNMRGEHRILSYSADFMGYYQPDASEEGLCVFNGENNLSLSLSCDGNIQQEMEVNAERQVWLRYGNYDDTGNMTILDYDFSATDDAEEAHAYGIFYQYEEGFCYFILQDDGYSDLVIGCSEEDANAFDLMRFYNIYYYVEYPQLLAAYQPDEFLPATPVYFRGEDGGICNFEREDGYTYRMYCNAIKLDLDKRLTIRYIPNVIDDYPLLISVER